jgi:S1-C subfamily serine protease
MLREPLGGGAGAGRRWRGYGTTALALVTAGIVAAGFVAPIVAPVGPAAAEGRLRAGPLAYHATIVNGPITGSGFLIADGIAITNAHVIAETRPGAQVRLIASNGSGREAVGRVLAVSRRMDIALVRVPPGFLPVAPAADAPLRRGRSLRAAGVIAQGSGPGPRLELDGAIASEPLLLPPYGPGFIASMPGVRRGFSGGPVFDGDGRLAGMIAALRPAPGGAVSATGAPLTGVEAFVLGAPVIRAEAARLLANGR